jgi:DNA-binding CsgD family transcriptional regulator/PAS domain-containing protein
LETIVAAVPRPKFEAIIEDLYAGTLDASAWNRAIGSLIDLIDSSGAMLFAVNPTTGKMLRDEIHRLDPQTEVSYRETWVSQDPRIISGLQRPVGEPTHTHQVVSESDWNRSAIFNEFLIPADIPFVLATLLHKSPQKMVALTFQASWRRGPFDDADAHTVRQLFPHIRRALEIRDRLEAHEIRASSLVSAMSRSHFGVIVLDENGRILEATGLAHELLRAEPSIRRERDQTLSLREPAGSRLRQWVMTGTPPKNSPDGLLSIPRSNGLPDLSVVVTPMPVGAIAWTGGDPRWLLFVFDPARRVQPSNAMVSRDLGISMREAEVVVQLAMGHNLSVVSTRLGISMNTARAHLKHVFAKTNLRSQSELVRRVLTGPAIHDAGG